MCTSDVCDSQQWALCCDHALCPSWSVLSNFEKRQMSKNNNKYLSTTKTRTRPSADKILRVLRIYHKM